MDNKRTLRVYTDGSASPNPGKGAYAYVVVDGNNDVLRKYSKSFMETTNNRMELRPLVAVLQWLQTNPLPVGNVAFYNKVIITSDSEYLILGVQGRMAKWKKNEWHNATGKKVVNLDIWKKIDRLIVNFRNLEFKLIKGHSGDYFNEMADNLAVKERTNSVEPCIDLEYINSRNGKQLTLF